MKYKVILDSPFYNVGDIIDSKDVHYNMANHPIFFEKIKIESSISMDGFTVETPQKIYLITKDFKIRETWYSGYLDGEIFFLHLKNAEDYIISKIELEAENGTISGTNIPMYGVCVKAQWEITETTSLKLFQRNQSENKLSDSWKWFTSEELRDYYIKWNKPIYSLYDITNNKINYE